MNILQQGQAAIVPLSVNFSAQSPTQTEMTDRGVQVTGEESVAREYEVRESSLSAFITAQLAAGRIASGKLVQVQASSSGEGDLYQVTVTTSSISAAPASPYFSLAEGFVFTRPVQEPGATGPNYPTLG